MEALNFLNLWKRVRVFFLLFLVPALLGISGCDSTEKDWERTLRDDTIASYEEFVSEHPDAQQVAEAKDHLAWKLALDSDTGEGYRDYMMEYKTGKFFEAALAKIEQKDWEFAKESDRPDQYIDFWNRHPESPHLIVEQGELRKQLAYAQGGGDSQLAISMNGGESRTLDMAEIIDLGLYDTHESGIMMLRAGTLQATMLRDKASGQILAIVEETP